jgi:DNA topoisomerase-3
LKLIITEKPSVAISIAKVLGVEGRKDGYIENKDYVISWCIGHLVSLSQADSYDEKYKKWSYDDLPIIPSDYKYEVFKASKKQYDILRKLMNRTDITEIINACDSGREGELIFRLVYSQTLSKKPIKRLWISSMEESAIKDGFNNLRNGIEFDNLYKSALARAQADWLVGINATRLFTVLYNQLLSVGRVQTPTLALIVDRGEEINNFVKEKFYHLDLVFKDFIASSEKFTDKDKLEELQNKVKDNIAIVKETKVEKKKTNPPLPFDLTSLQREANRLFSYTAKQTLDYAQALYEKKWITYPRTDSRYLTDEMLGNLEELVKSLDKDKILKEANFSRIINNKKVQDHHALIPTKESLNMDKNNIPKTEKRIYDLVTIKLLESLSMLYEEEVVTIVLEVAESRFTAKGKRILDLGYKEISKNYNKKANEEIKENILPKISKDIKFKIENTKIREGLTQPPKQYTEDTLLSAMERAGNGDLDKSLDTEKRGLGTPATRASIIERLIKVGYIERKNKNIIPTQKGISLTTVIPDILKSPKLTADWEDILNEIASGKVSDKAFIEGIGINIKELVKNYSHISVDKKERFNTNKEIIGECPRCQSHIFEGKKNFYCSNKDCGFSLFKEDRFFLEKRKKLTKDMAKTLLEYQEVLVKDLYSKKANKNYDAYVSFVDTGKYINYKLRFPNNKKD